MMTGGVSACQIVLIATKARKARNDSSTVDFVVSCFRGEMPEDACGVEPETT